jgi:hypothetical protein
MVIADMLAGIRRARIGGPDRKAAADADVVMQLLWSIEGSSLAAMRDRALIAFGMALAARRSELVALDIADLTWEAKGLRVTIRRSKTDQDSEGAVVAVPEGRRLTPSLTSEPGWRRPRSPKGRCSGRCGSRGRDAGHPAPPAQIRACAANALGSCLGYLTSKRWLGQGWLMTAGGSHALTIRFMRSHGILCRWLRRRSDHSQAWTTW